MKAKGLGALAVGLAIAMLGGVSPQAQAKPGYEVKPDGFRSRIFLIGNNGFLVIVSSVGHKQVELTAFGDEGTATYRAPGRASRNGIEADFGDFGRIAMRFHGSPKSLSRSQEDGCRGKRTISATGTFRGALEFEGEGGFASASTREAGGFFVRSFRRVCKVRKGPRKPDRNGPRKTRPPPISVHADTLIAESRELGRRTAFANVELELKSGRKAAVLTVAGASSVEHVGAVRVSRETFTIDDDRTLLISPANEEPTFAKVAPPRPFRGTATYSKDAGSPPGWRGNLAVRFPGIGNAPLAGEGFRAVLCRDPPSFARCRGRLNEQTFPAVARWLAQLSGSQSQAFWDARLSWSR